MSSSTDATLASAPARGRPRSFDRDAVLDLAMRVFWAKGFAGASMSDLTAAMGIASPSLYAAFGSKEGLYRAAIDHYVATYGGAFRDVMRLPTARESVEGLLRNAACAFSAVDGPSGCMVVQTAVEACEVSPELADSLCELRASNAETLVSRLRRAVEEGDVAAGTDVRAVANFYSTVHKGLSLSAKGGALRDELDSVVTSAMAAWAPLTAG
ncbi:TetR/AcrR family transcriptional regulator [soil metagenome]